MVGVESMAAKSKPIYGFVQYPQTGLPFHDNPDMGTNETIAANLNAWINSVPGLTSKKLAAKSGVGFGTIQRARNADGNLTVRNMEALAASFGRKATDLLTPPPSEYAPDDSTTLLASEPAMPTAYRDADVAALIAAAERLSPEDARALLPVVSRIADSTAPSAAKPNINNTRIDMERADDSKRAANQ